MKEIIAKAVNSVKKYFFSISDGVKARENISLFIALLIFAIVPFLFLRHPYDFFTLIAPMYVNEYGGIVAWLAFGKPIWQISVTCASVCNVMGILLYLGVDLGKIVSSKIKKIVPKNFHPNTSTSQNPVLKKVFLFFEKIKRVASGFQKRRAGLIQKITAWILRRGILFAYFLCTIPFIPYIGMILIVLFKVRGQKSGIWVLCSIGYIRAFLTVLAIYYGFHLTF